MGRQSLVSALFLCVAIISLPPFCHAAHTREYFLAAEDVSWDYAPGERDLIHGRLVPAPWLNHTRWEKIRHVSLLYAYLVTLQNLEPNYSVLSSAQPLAPGSEQTVAANVFGSGKNLGWAFFPGEIIYEDGTKWEPKPAGECFHFYWRDKDHPEMPVLPPFQMGQAEED
jgi:hypothetical protein